MLSTGKFYLKFDLESLRTLAAVTLVFSGQAVLYVVREREHLWNSPPGWLLASSITDVTIISILAVKGILMTALPLGIVAGLFTAAALLALVLDAVKQTLFRRLAIA